MNSFILEHLTNVDENQEIVDNFQGIWWILLNQFINFSDTKMFLAARAKDAGQGCMLESMVIESQLLT